MIFKSIDHPDNFAYQHVKFLSLYWLSRPEVLLQISVYPCSTWSWINTNPIHWPEIPRKLEIAPLSHPKIKVVSAIFITMWPQGWHTYRKTHICVCMPIFKLKFLRSISIYRDGGKYNMQFSVCLHGMKHEDRRKTIPST